MPKLLFISMLPFYPDRSGGAEQSALYLFKSLRQLGWQVELMCGLALRSPYFRRACWLNLKRFQIPSSVLMDEEFGYPCWRRLNKFSNERQWIEWLDQRLREYQPDVVVGQNSPECPLLNYAARKGYPSFYFLRNVGCIEAGAAFSDKIHIIANSPFTAATTTYLNRKEVGVVLPFVERDRYRATKRERCYISFINLIPEKGVDIAIQVARSLPQERFLFVKGKWRGNSDSSQQDFMKEIYSLPNVEVWEHQQDMRRVYAVTDILLFPSQFQETFGRVVLEAQVNGIPVVASKVGGIPYTLGQGGILVEPKDEPQAYVDTLQRLRNDEKRYAQLSALAIENSQRSEFDPHYQVENFIQFVESRNSAKLELQEN